MTPAEYLATLKEDFTFFMEQIWINRKLDQFHPFGWVERDVCHFLQYGPTKQGVLAHRGFGKTHLATAGLTCFDLINNPDWKILIVSKSENEAVKTVHLIREWIDNVPFLRHLKPSNRPRDRKEARDTTKHFDVGPAKEDRTPSVVAKGVEGQITGTRAHRIIPDDVETEANAATLDSRQLLAKKVNEFTAIASYGQRRINYIGTFHHEESLYIEESKKGVTFRSWPLLYPTAKEKVHSLAPSIQGRLDSGEAKPGDIVADYRYDWEFVHEQLARGASWFAMQHMLIADLGDSLRYPLRLENLIIFESMGRDEAPLSIAWGKNNGQGQSTQIESIPFRGFTGDGFYRPIMFDNQWARFTGTKMWVDPAKGTAGGDKIGYGVVAHAVGHLWVKDVGGLSGGSTTQNLIKLILKAREHNVTEIHVEDIGLQDSYALLIESLIRPYFIEKGANPDYPDGWRCSVHATKPPMAQQQKELRIIGALEGPVGTHRIIISREVALNEEFQRQFSRITRQRDCLGHEDELEAMAMCCWLWQDLLSIDPIRSSERQREKQLKQQILDYQKRCGIRVKRPAYFTHDRQAG